LVGDASYSLYLFHPYVLNVFNRVLRPSYDPGSPSAYLMALLAIAVCCGVAVVLYRLLELPLTTWLRRKFLPRRSEQSRGVDASAISAP
jgi:peptidoglycan/LPS O-acetylase OafA/YrhL